MPAYSDLYRTEALAMLGVKIKGSSITVPLPVLRGSETKPPRIRTREKERESTRSSQRSGLAVNRIYATELLIMLLVMLVVIFLWAGAEPTGLQIARFFSHPVM